MVKKAGSKQYFLSRPRRFGKSLLLSTIQCIFEGKREFFKGFYIDWSHFEWQIYPVIRLDMNSSVANNSELTISRVNNLFKSEIDRINVEVSIFSDLNNLVDITMYPQFSDICGFTNEWA